MQEDLLWKAPRHAEWGYRKEWKSEKAGERVAREKRMCSSVFPSLKPSFMVFRFEFYDPQNYLHIFEKQHYSYLQDLFRPLHACSLGAEQTSRRWRGRRALMVQRRGLSPRLVGLLAATTDARAVSGRAWCWALHTLLSFRHLVTSW